MTQPARRAVSYLPGRWAALVTDELCLLSELQLADPALAACWDAAAAPDPAEPVIEALTRSGRPTSFVLVARTGAGLRLVVAGRAHAEVFAGQQDPVVHGAPNPQSWVDEQLDPALDVRLVADDATPFERISPLPLTSGIVLASFVFSTAVAVTPPPGGPQGEAAGWIPPPLPQPSSEYPIPPADDPGWPSEPPSQLSGVFRALPWRTSFAESDAPPASGLPATAGSADVVAPPATWSGTPGGAEPLPPAPPVPEPSAPESLRPRDDRPKPSFGAPGYEPPPFGAEAWGMPGHGDAPAGNSPYGDGSYEPAFEAPSATQSPPAAQIDAGAEPPAPGPVVQAVHCDSGHLNPPHIDVCRFCGAGFAPQQPVTVERPPLGVLRVAAGEVVVLDKDVLLGRAPFAVDQTNVRMVAVPSPDNDISRSHLRITLEGWQVFATDLGSTNGTAVTLPGQPATLLRPHDPFALVPGAILSLADEADVRFELQ